MNEWNLDLCALKRQIEESFKSLMHSGRPDVYDEHKNDITRKIYTDLFGEDYVLRQVVDGNHCILKGRRGTGKSTIFVRAEAVLIEKEDGSLPIYINLQTCYEETPNKTDTYEGKLLTYKRFLKQVLRCIKEKIVNQCKEDIRIEQLFQEIENGRYIDASFKREIEIASTYEENSGSSINAQLGIKQLGVNASKADGIVGNKSIKYLQSEIKIFCIHDILSQIKDIVRDYEISSIYLFLDDYSELSMDNQKIIVDALISPIISSYNDTFKVKIAAYPNRIYMGNIDSTKIPIIPLDFYEAFGQINKDYKGIEKEAIDYIQRTLENRIKFFTNNQLEIEEIFDIQDNLTLTDYLTKLFEVTAAIPRSLGFILNYCYLASINKNKTITISDIDAASFKYYENNIYPDFINDIRFKQAFHDDEKLLDQISQKYLVNEMVKYLYEVKRSVIDKHNKKCLENKLFEETLEKYRKGNLYWIPTSHFYVDKIQEKLLNTLELYFIVHKFNEGSKRGAEVDKVSYYGLNYGLCQAKKIDYGRPTGRRSADYRRQSEFDLTNTIPQILSSVEVIKCEQCGLVYDETKYEIYKEFGECFKCHTPNSVRKTNKFADRLESKLNEWRSKSLPNICIDILRVLYNNQDTMLSAYEIGKIIDKHHMSVWHGINKLGDYVQVEKQHIRYYSITEKAINQFFVDDIESLIS